VVDSKGCPPQRRRTFFIGGPAEIRSVTKEGEIEALVADAFAGLQGLVAAFDDPNTPYIASPRDNRALRYSDYDHLARVQEWAQADGGESGT
jgi:hypothetical protein